MNTITLWFVILAAIITAVILRARKPSPLTQCATPKLEPPTGTGPQGGSITVMITTLTTDAYLRWTDDGSTPSGSSGTNGHLIKASSGPAPTVFGRTMRAIAFKTGWTDSSIATGHYTSTAR